MTSLESGPSFFSHDNMGHVLGYTEIYRFLNNCYIIIFINVTFLAYYTAVGKDTRDVWSIKLVLNYNDA